jgi:sigma-B regulation protein RsbU (phosphoserine phosphatase)
MELTLHKPDGSTESFTADAERLDIGRARDNEIVIADPMLSRRHAVLYRDENEQWWVEDMGSRNGTWLNGVPLETPKRFGAGDVIELGNSSLSVSGDAGSSGDRPLLETTESEQATIFASRTPDESLGGQGQLLASAARALVSGEPAKAKLEHLLRLAVLSAGADRGIIASVDESDELHPIVAVPAFDDSNPPRVSRAVLRKVLDSGEAVIAADVKDEQAFKASETLLEAGVASVLCAPLSGEEARVLGMLYLDTVGRRASFQPHDLEVANVLGGMAGITLEAESVRIELETKRRLEADLSAAWDIQQSLLPPADPATPKGLVACAHHAPCQAVGGDLYDIFPMGAFGFGAMVADVAGKGLPAALLGAELHGRWKGLTDSNTDPSQWPAKLNGGLTGQLPSNRFVTLAFAVADTSRDLLTLGSAGQTSIFIRGGEVEVLGATGPVLGMMPGTSYGLIERPFEPGCRLILFTDGVTDQVSPEGEPFEMQGLLDTARRFASSDAHSLRDAVIDALSSHAQRADQSDDTTLVVLSRET